LVSSDKVNSSLSGKLPPNISGERPNLSVLRDEIGFGRIVRACGRRLY
jgi:hypothetical protein